MLTEEQQVQFTRLWTESQPVVSQYVASLVANRSRVADVVQNTSVALLKKFEQYDASRPFLPWALGVAKFEVLGDRRDAARNRIVCDSELLSNYTAAWGEIAPKMPDETTALQRCVGRLQTDQQEILRLRYVEDLNSDAIGARLSRTATNIRTMLHRIRTTLRRCVEGQLSTEGSSS